MPKTRFLHFPAAKSDFSRLTPSPPALFFNHKDTEAQRKPFIWG